MGRGVREGRGGGGRRERGEGKGRGGGERGGGWITATTASLWTHEMSFSVHLPSVSSVRVTLTSLHLSSTAGRRAREGSSDLASIAR